MADCRKRGERVIKVRLEKDFEIIVFLKSKIKYIKIGWLAIRIDNAIYIPRKVKYR